MIQAVTDLARLALSRILMVRSGDNDHLVQVLAIGGQHQFLHLIPVACELEKRFPGKVTIFTCIDSDAEGIADIARELNMTRPRIVRMSLPRWIENVLPNSFSKVARLLLHAPRIADGALVLCAERTSTILPRIFRGFPPLLHIPHGVGDREVGFEKRFKWFDEVLVAGNKDRDRLLASGHTKVGQVHVTGPIKLASIFRHGVSKPRLFDNDRPVLLYNPHFSTQHRSFDSFVRPLIEAVVKDERYNLVVAPHVRLCAEMSMQQRAHWEARSIPGRLIIDLGSRSSFDMTYTSAADLYIGDVSSQVYEYLVCPRPCLFVNAHGVDWREDENYAMWHFGEVIQPSDDPLGAIDRAFADHGAYARWQKQRLAYAVEGISWRPDGGPFLVGPDPVEIAADHVAKWLVPISNVGEVKVSPVFAVSS